VPGFIEMKPPPPVPAGATTTTATGPVSAAAEEEMWHGHASQVLMLGTYLFWTMTVFAALVVAYLLGFHWWALCVCGAILFFAALHCGIGFLHLRTVEYVVTTQRVRIVSGLLSKSIQEIELFRVKDTMVGQTLFLRLFGLGTITIISGDAHNPYIVLSAVPKPIELRERLRQEVMALRQRYGVREMDVM